MSEPARPYAFTPLAPSAPPAPDAPAQAIARAEAQADQIRELARREGFEQGLREGRAEGATASRSAAEAMASACERVLAQRREMADVLEREAIDLALGLAGKILGGALEVQPERVLDVVRGALRHLTDRRAITVIVDPADLDLVTESIGAVRAEIGGVEVCDVQADRRVGRGGAIVRTPEGEVDASMAVQLERAREVIASELSAEAPGEAAADTGAGSGAP